MRIQADIQGFTDSIARSREALLRKQDTVVRGSVLDLWQDVVRKTPVSSGRARAGWRLETALGNESPPSAPYSHGQGRTRVRSYPEPVPPEVPSGSDAYWVYNHVDYIVPLEHGSASRPPYGMVALALERFPDRFRDRSGDTGWRD